jgi:photosystem II stability/assembly factor-like uncharacterized protein
MIAAALLLCSAASAESRWKMQYMYDEDKSALALADIEFSSPLRGIAVGVIQQKHSTKPVALVTSDGGAHWTTAPLPDDPRSLFTATDGAVYLVGDSGVWVSAEGGRDWKRILKNKRLTHVYFLTPQHGFATGGMKTVLETKDGGGKWEPVAAAEEPSTTPERTSYNWISFWTPEKGLIVGRSSAIERNEKIPLWMETEPELRRELPAITIFLQTLDGGKSWKISQNTIFGSLTRFMVDPSGRGVGLIEFTSYGKVPSEILELNDKNKSFSTVYQDPKHYVTDVAIVPKGPVFAAGIEVPGRIAQSPIPTKVKVLESLDMKTWAEMKVDYRAAATRVHLAESGGDVWLATDTGMILKLVND